MQFEDKIIANILYDEEYAFKILPYTKTDYFDQDYKIVVDEIVKFFTEYGAIPTKDELIIEVSNRRGLTDKQVGNIKDLVASYKRDDSDREWLTKNTEKFYQERSLTNAIINGASILEKGNQNTNEILKMVQDALSVSFDSHLGHDYYHDIQTRFDAYHLKEDKITTGVPVLDKITLGGFSRKSLNCVLASSGCHAKGSRVVMHDGSLKNVEDVVVGDILKGYNNEYRQVLKLVRGREVMYKIKPIRNKEFVVNGNHILPLRNSHTGNLVNITVEDYIKSSAAFKNKHYLWNNPFEVEFDNNVELPIEPYFMGIWLGDGSTHALRITTQEKVIVDYLHEFAQHNDVEVNKLSNNNHEFSFNYALVMKRGCGYGRHNPIIQKFEQLGIFIAQDDSRTKCDEKFIPEIYFHSSVSDRYQLLAGLIDTDGHSNRSYYEYSSKSKRLVNDIARLAGSLGFNYSFFENVVNGTRYYRVNIFGDIAKIPCKVERKKSNFKRVQNKHPNAMSFTVEKLDEDDYYGFTLDGDHLYYTDNWIVQHNCGKSLLLVSTACNALRAGYNVLYITLEMSEVRIAERVDANMLSVTIPSLSKMDIKQYTQKIDDIKDVKHGRMIIKEFPTSSASVLHFKNLLNELKLKQGFIPDIIMVDYINLMTSCRYKAGMVNSYGMVKAVSEELRGLAVEQNVAILTATQTNRSGMNSSDIEMDQVSDSIGLVFTLDMLFALIRTEALDQANQIMVKQLKNRYTDLNNLPVIELGINRDHMRIYDMDADPYKVDPNDYKPKRAVVPTRQQETAPNFYQEKKIQPKNDFSKFQF